MSDSDGARDDTRDYSAVARALRGARDALASDLGSPTAVPAMLIMDNLTLELAGYFAGTNPRFSVGWFADAAGVPESVTGRLT